MALGTDYGVLQLRDPATLEIFPWSAAREHRGGIGRMAFSANGQVLATSGEESAVKIWRMPDDFQQRQPLRSERTIQLKGNIQSISLSPDGSVVFVGFAETEVWDVASGEQLFVVPGQEVACSPDGTQFVTGGGKLGSEAVVWDIKDASERARLQGASKSPIMSVAFTADGRHIITGDYAGKLSCWDASSGDEVADFRNAHDR
jgi:WD40 repeat protein